MTLKLTEKRASARLWAFAQRYIPNEIRLILGLVVVAALIGCVYMIINDLTHHYAGFNYLPLRWIILAPVIFALLILAMYAQDKTPQISFFTITYAAYFFVILSFAVLTNGMQYTPFPTIDKNLLHLDQLIGFNSIALIQWTAAHPPIKKLFELVYEFLDVEMFLVPLLLPWFFAKKRVYELLITMLVVFLLGTSIYYFFPTAAPTSVLHSSYFLPAEYATSTKFYQIHHYLPVTTGDGGMIAFPSFHVVWAIILSYSLRGKIWLFCSFAIINVIVILSTLFLGWHYLIDVIAGILLATVVISMLPYVVRRVVDVPVHQ
jgi:membrane-associated phospholipid phosphatase